MSDACHSFLAQQVKKHRKTNTVLLDDAFMEDLGTRCSPRHLIRMAQVMQRQLRGHLLCPESGREHSFSSNECPKGHKQECDRCSYCPICDLYNV